MTREQVGPGDHSGFVRQYVRRIVMAAFMLVLLLPGIARAQTGGFSGTVTDAGTGAGVLASVAVYSWNGGFVTSVVNNRGHRRLSRDGTPGRDLFRADLSGADGQLRK